MNDTIRAAIKAHILDDSFRPASYYYMTANADCGLCGRLLPAHGPGQLPSYGIHGRRVCVRCVRSVRGWPHT